MFTYILFKFIYFYTRLTGMIGIIHFFEQITLNCLQVEGFRHNLCRIKGYAIARLFNF